MSEVTVARKYARVSPRKLRAIVQTLRGSQLDQATQKLKLVNRQGKIYISKLLKHAQNVAETKNLLKDRLRITKFVVNEGPRLKRWLPAPRGRSYRITKRMSHLVVTLSDNAKSQTPNTKS